MTITRGILAAAGLVLSAGCAAAAAPPTWQGTLYVSAINSACTNATVAAVGDFWTIEYRPKIATTDPADAFHILGPRSSMLMTTANSNGKFGATGLYNGTWVDGFARSVTVGPTSANTAAVALTLPAGVSTVTATTRFVVIKATIGNWFERNTQNAGCTVTFDAALIRRVD